MHINARDVDTYGCPEATIASPRYVPSVKVHIGMRLGKKGERRTRENYEQISQI